MLFLIPSYQAFYLAGVAPTNYAPHQKVDLLVNALTSPKSIPYDYYTPEFHFCSQDPQPQPESLGSILFGDRLFSSPFEVDLVDVAQDVGEHHL
jgi:transmembrane 9 superfamily protein 2/4